MNLWDGGHKHSDHSKYKVQVKECRMNGLALAKQFTVFTNINTKNIGQFSTIYELERTLNPSKVMKSILGM